MPSTASDQRGNSYRLLAAESFFVAIWPVLWFFAQDVVIQPGRKGEIKWSISTKQRQPGVHRESVCYHTNDRLNPSLVFTAVFEVATE